MAVISWLVLKANLTYLRWIKARLIKRSVGTYCSVSKLCLTLCDPMNCSMPGFPVLHYLLEFAQTHVHWVSDAIQSSHSLLPLSHALDLSQLSGSFPMTQLFISGGQRIGASASASVLLMNIQGWFPLGLTGLISLQSKWLWRFFSSTSLKASIIQRSAFFMV